MRYDTSDGIVRFCMADASMGMAVVDIREMRVRMGNRRVLMEVRMRFLTVPLKIVRVSVVLVVPVSMVMV